MVWGDPLRSDSPYYLVQDFIAVRQKGITIFEYWHSPEVPDGLLTVVAADPAAFFAHVAAGVPAVIIKTLRAWAYWSLPVAAVLALLGGTGLVALWRRGHRLAVLGLALLAGTHVALWSIRSLSFESRYLSVLAVFFVVVCCVGFTTLVRALGRGPAPALSRGLVGAIVALTLLVPSVRGLVELRSPNASLLEFEAFYRSVDAATSGEGPVVVGDKPYFFTWATNRESLSIPYADDDFLQAYMQKYGSGTVALTATEIEFWRPNWLEPGGLPDFLEPVPGVSGHVFRRVDG